ncbi:hypothetical protein [Anaerovorax sp. IOR16]|uniref:hypothetical protein n=1 Tax=Anaerovorax sp. IOR16 TaxID=2773458 RepID=UPI0019D28D37|nr:hypothetical protein [Anaerovorax sp. IOR16]
MGKKKYYIIFCFIFLIFTLVVDVLSPDFFNIHRRNYSEHLKYISEEDYLSQYRIVKEASRNDDFLEIETILQNYMENKSEVNIQPIEITKRIVSDNIVFECKVIALLDLNEENKIVVIPKSVFLVQAVPLDKGIKFKLAGPHCDIWEEEPTILIMEVGRIDITEEAAKRNNIDLSTYVKDAFIENNYCKRIDIYGEYVFTK